MINVMTKARKQQGIVYPAAPTDYSIEFTGEAKAGYDSITIHRVMRDGSVKVSEKFCVGSAAEYDSYNLSYIGVITKITNKNVTLVKYQNTPNARTYRLDINEFCWRNIDFNEATVRANNHTESMYL